MAGKTAEIIQRLRDGVVEYDEAKVVEAAQAALEAGVSADDAIFDGLVKGMAAVGELYECQEYFVPEVLLSSEALYAGLRILQPHMKEEKAGSKGQVVLGVVQGDVHDIGKNMVKMMFEVGGFTVHDLGRDVPIEKFAAEQLRTESEMVCLSSMMTTTMKSMPEIIRSIKEKNPKCRIMVGGAPLSESIAEKWGADGYAADANNALKEAIKMIAMLGELRGKAS